jgi:uncharacterized membrane protein YoaK (UPF0700 family)
LDIPGGARFPSGMPVPRIIPALLSFTAGFVDSCTFLALFGLYVAQATGSFVVLGIDFVAHEQGFVIKVLAIPMFFAAGVFATILAHLLRRRGRAPLPWALALECALLGAFLLVGLTLPMRDADAPATVLAAMLGLSAMGVQSALVRLLMPGVASTNVMTTNTTLFAIDTGEFLLGWHGKRRGDAEAVAQYAAARERLSQLIPLGIGFLAGTVAGAFGYVWFGLWCLLAVLALLLGLIVWAGSSA